MAQIPKKIKTRTCLYFVSIFIFWILAMPGLKADGTGPFVLRVLVLSFLFLFLFADTHAVHDVCKHFILQAFAKTLNDYT